MRRDNVKTAQPGIALKLGFERKWFQAERQSGPIFNVLSRFEGGPFHAYWISWWFGEEFIDRNHGPVLLQLHNGSHFSRLYKDAAGF